jgi:hypothetical protein
VTTVRLHPRRDKVEDRAASKLGGVFLWPQGEAWPTCNEPGHHNDMTGESYPDGTEARLVPVLQLRATDFPELPFRPGTDLFQLLWCPLAHEGPTVVAKPFAFWRTTADVAAPREKMPTPTVASKWFLPAECRLHPERLTEYPERGFADDMWEKVRRWCEARLPGQDLRTPEEWFGWFWNEHSICPGNKVAGLPRWVQDDETPTCACGRAMKFLLTLTDNEFDGASYQRWCPEEDRRVLQDVYLRPPTVGTTQEEQQALADILDPARFEGFVGGSQYVFVCRSCEGWPICSVYQR